jgi:putative FmdB family regulatory protein
MPIYAYRCENCGHAKDVLQKVSDPVLTVCPACGQPTFRKQVTAAGFQLKGSGWYVTDFRGDAKGKPGAEAASSSKEGGDKASAKTDSSSSEASPSATGSPAPAADKAAAPAASPAPAAPASPSGGGKPG